MYSPPTNEFLVAEDIGRIQREAEESKVRDRLLLGIVNIGLALNYEKIILNHNAQMVLALVALTPGVGVTKLAEILRMSPGGISKILDQLSTGRMIRGIRQPGLDLIQRESGQGCFLTKEGDRIISVIVKALKPT